MVDLRDSLNEKQYLVLHRFGDYALLPMGDRPDEVMKSIVRDQRVGLERLTSHKLTYEDFSRADASLEKGALVWVKKRQNVRSPLSGILRTKPRGA